MNDRYPWIDPPMPDPRRPWMQGPLLEGLLILSRDQYRELYARVQPHASPDVVDGYYDRYVSEAFGDQAFGPRIGGLAPHWAPNGGPWQ